MNEVISVYDNKKDCCGCACCVNICPKRAIHMEEDEYGFKYPVIDKAKCVNCGLCKKCCKYQTNNKEMYECQKVYVSVTQDTELIRKSASGGIFANIARNFIRDNGIIYGSAMNYKNDKLIVEHIRIDKENELIKLQGSKYVQSNIEESFKSIQNDLKENKKVLFSGTPCQIEAIKEYLKKDNIENLFCIDIICHGVPSNKMFNEYITLIEKKYKGKVVDFKFRDKSRNWGLNGCAYIKRKGRIIKKIIPSYDSSYYQLFLDSELYRDNCYECPYACKKRVGDITIGDYWKVENEHQELIKLKKIDINNGVSCILVNNDKGNFLINKYGENLKLFESNFEKVSKHNEQLVKASELKASRKCILERYKTNGYKSVDMYYRYKNLKKIMIKKCWYKLPLKVRSKLKK